MNDLPVVRSPWRILILVLGFTFLYAPMLMLVIYSFNSSKLVTSGPDGRRAGIANCSTMMR